MALMTTECERHDAQGSAAARTSPSPHCRSQLPPNEWPLLITPYELPLLIAP
jgi:hypothetical protein